MRQVLKKQFADDGPKLISPLLCLRSSSELGGLTGSSADAMPCSWQADEKLLRA
jgi:hypothetical protein